MVKTMSIEKARRVYGEAKVQEILDSAAEHVEKQNIEMINQGLEVVPNEDGTNSIKNIKTGDAVK